VPALAVRRDQRTDHALGGLHRRQFLAQALAAEGQVEEALSLYRRLVGEFESGSRRTEGLFRLGDLYMRAGKPDRLH
jgi:hypothetical protein